MTAPAARLRRRVEHVDTDGSGVVHFSRHAAFLETVAIELLTATGFGLDELQQAGFDLRMRELRIGYQGAARHREWLNLEAVIEHVGPARVRISARSACDGPEGQSRPVASGMLDFAVVEAATGAPVALRDDIARCWRGES